MTPPSVRIMLLQPSFRANPASSRSVHLALRGRLIVSRPSSAHVERGAATTAKKVTFEILGPYEVSFHGDLRMLTQEEGTEFFRDHPHLRDRRGAYVFAIRSGGGMSPIYVGEATKGFGQECFTNDKLLKYALGLAIYHKGIPVMFFVASLQKRGRVNVTVIDD